MYILNSNQIVNGAVKFHDIVEVLVSVNLKSLGSHSSASVTTRLACYC